MTDSKLHDELISALHKFIKDNGLLSHYILNNKVLNHIKYNCETLTPLYISIIFDTIYYNGGSNGNSYPLDIQNNWRNIANNITTKYAIRLLKKQNPSAYRIIRSWSNRMPTYRKISKFLKFDGQKYIGDNIFMTYGELLTICDNIKKES